MSKTTSPGWRTYFGIALLIAICAVFWREASALASDSLKSTLTNTSGGRHLSDEDLDTIREFYFEPGIEISSTADTVSDVRLVSQAGRLAVISLRLTRGGTDTGEAQDSYPILTVFFYNEAGQLLRSQNFTPEGGYRHRAALSDEPIELSFDFQPSEVKFKVHARRLALHDIG